MREEEIHVDVDQETDIDKNKSSRRVAIIKYQFQMLQQLLYNSLYNKKEAKLIQQTTQQNEFIVPAPNIGIQIFIIEAPYFIIGLLIFVCAIVAGYIQSFFQLIQFFTKVIGPKLIILYKIQGILLIPSLLLAILYKCILKQFFVIKIDETREQHQVNINLQTIYEIITSPDKLVKFDENTVVKYNQNMKFLETVFYFFSLLISLIFFSLNIQLDLISCTFCGNASKAVKEYVSSKIIFIICVTLSILFIISSTRHQIQATMFYTILCIKLVILVKISINYNKAITKE